MADYTSDSNAPRPSEGAGQDGGGADRRSRPYAERRPRRDSRRPAKICQFCSEKVDSIDYKNAGLLRQFVSERGRIFPRRKTGTCAKHQRLVSEAIKRARFLALLPYTASHVRVQSS